ncbi:MAG: DUF1987 domain-containing protein [Chlorobi bacterium]|nr:DUF1987 domain-containing protein [Chlorobiota bacterium]
MFKIEATKTTPLVNISVKDCIFEIKGFSFANDSDSFFEPVMEYINNRFSELECELNCKFYLSVFNSVTYKYILNMMARFMEFNKNGKNIKVVWYFDSDDEDNKENAEDISELFNIPFKLVEITD